MKLVNLKLQNFKGIKNFELNAQGQDVNIFGDNATGKTTLADAFMWLLFNKDSHNRTDFEIKTLGFDGAPEHGLEHIVEAALQLPSGKSITLKKVFYEKWTKKRGSALAEFTGHTTDYYLNGVPVQKKEYDEQIAQIADEDIFRLLTDPTYFNTQLHWQKRRELLIEVCGDVLDEEILDAEPKLIKLKEVLADYSIDDLKKIIMAKRTEINQELKKIPVRIDEVKLGLPDITGLALEKLEEESQSIQSKIKEKQQELARVEAGGEIAEKRKKLAEIDTEIIKIKQEHQAKNEDQLVAKQREINDVKLKIDQYQSENKLAENNADMLFKQAKRTQTAMFSKREEWETINKKEFLYSEEDTCPTCGQGLPEEQLTEARDKALAQFNAWKSNQLELVAEEGKQLKMELERLQKEHAEAIKDIPVKETEVLTMREQLTDLKLELSQLSNTIVSVQENSRYKEKIADKLLLEEAITQLKQDVSASMGFILEEIKEWQEVSKEIENDKSKIALNTQGNDRINQLKAEERKLAAEYEALEEQLYLTEEFIRTKVTLLDEKINSKFKMAKFKLFNTLVNGGIEECCETTHDGVPFGNLNSGARLNVGLDIINVLADHYNFAPAVWIDNAESVTNILPTEGQQIKLVVSEQDKKLRIEEPKSIKEAV